MKRRLHRLPLSDKDFDDEGYMRSIQHNRHIFTAWLDARVDKGGRRWRDLLKSVGIHIDNTLDPPRVQPGDRYRLYRGIFNEVTKTYYAELFSSKESKSYILNGGIGEGSSGVKDWEAHLDCPAECRCLHCAVWKPPPVLIVETELKNPNLGKTIIATQHLKPLDYIAEHSGERKAAAESMSAAERREAEGQKIDRMEVKIPGRGTLFIHQENMGGPTRYPNHSKTPNAEFERDPKYVSGAYRTMLRVKSGCHIKPGDPVTVDYGDLYFIGFGEEIYEGPGLLPR
ncbi:hypothetical protein DL98DRAFT_519590 [Cadophora sp. DSE1049]|nr:hypothetical protein DL98DRAFT_519590 [Cadophora sp. DSE1049]